MSILFCHLLAHSFALTDFGRAVGLDPEKATNYYLRGDCHGKLGNYELAIQDYNTADEKGFDDMVSLCMARGTLNRLIGQYRAATKDFDRALNHLKSVRGDGMLAIRIQLLRALCLIDVKKHARACQILLQAFDMLKTRNMSFSPIKEVLDTDDESDGSDDDLPLFNPSLDFEDKSANPSARPTLATPKPTSAGAVSTNVNTTGHLNKISVQHNLLNSRKINASQRHLNTFQDPDEMKGLYFRESENWTRENALKLEWTVQYHISLTLYMQKKYYEAAEVSFELIGYVIFE